MWFRMLHTVDGLQRVQHLWPQLQRLCLTAWVELYNGNVGLAGHLIIADDGVALDLQKVTMSQPKAMASAYASVSASSRGIRTCNMSECIPQLWRS